MPFLDLSDLKPSEPVPGAQARFVHSQHMTIAYWDISAGGAVPEHAHPHEQVCSVISGELELIVGGERRVMGPGAVAVIPPNAAHAGHAVTDCRVIDAFHPVREDYR